jgi:guanylate kinase
LDFRFFSFKKKIKKEKKKGEGNLLRTTLRQGAAAGLGGGLGVLVRWKQFGSMSGPNALVICGPSGVGKGTLIDMLKQEFPNAFGFSVSHTTREPRPGEKNGVHYHFVTVMQMEADIKAGKFIEYAKVHDNFYGTSRAAVESVKKTGKICILDIDVQGCRLCRQANVPGIYVFVSPPSFEVLEQRLRGRGTETEDKIVKRLANAKGEMDARNEAGLFDKQVRFLLYRALSPRVERVPGRCTADMEQTPAAHKHAFLGLFAAASLDGL